jgi:hypothetical protein
VVVVVRQRNVVQVVLALRPPSGFTSHLHSRQQQTDQNCNDRDHDQQFDQGKSLTGNTAGKILSHELLLRKRTETSETTNFHCQHKHLCLEANPPVPLAAPTIAQSQAFKQPPGFRRHNRNSQPETRLLLPPHPNNPDTKRLVPNPRHQGQERQLKQSTEAG